MVEPRMRDSVKWVDRGPQTLAAESRLVVRRPGAGVNRLALLQLPPPPLSTSQGLGSQRSPAVRTAGLPQSWGRWPQQSTGCTSPTSAISPLCGLGVVTQPLWAGISSAI